MYTGETIAITALFACLILALIILASRLNRKARCRSCGRARVPGEAACPFCGTPYVIETIPTELDRAPSPLPGQAPQLECAQGTCQGQTFPLTSSEFSIGRGSENKLPLEGVLVSRQHAVIVSKDGQNLLYDQESTNGTWVNQQRVAQHVLQPGDQIQIGPYVFIFQLPGVHVSPEPIAQPPEQIAAPDPPSSDAIDLGDYDWPWEPIGVGGMSTVYKSISRRDGTPVAIKVFHQRYDDYLLQKFKQEIQIGKQLSDPPHPHIARVLTGGTGDGTAYIIMEFVDNHSLRERLQPGRPMPLEHVVPIVGQTCDALHYAHGERIYHRDIKPENILFSSQDGVKLVDFGIAKWGTEVTQTLDGMLVGTPLYMSYEQAGSEKVDARSDIYSLGIVLYEMLTGRPPFVGEPVAVVHKHLTEKPVPPSRLNPQISSHIERVVMRALDKRPDKRYQTAEEMARALGYQAPFHTPASHRPVSQSRGTPRPGVQTEPRSPIGPGRLVSSSGQTIVLGAYVTVLERKNSNPEDEYISGTHACIRQHGGQFWLEDSGSRNGTYLNEQWIFEPVLLQDGDMIRVGHTNLRVELPSR